MNLEWCDYPLLMIKYLTNDSPCAKRAFHHTFNQIMQLFNQIILYYIEIPSTLQMKIRSPVWL